ncbi:hypothetical protein [Roseivirga seohaensis]|uniref:hypothetical protein n=1 Tax=Roseivirga seohaensis TaxID=1914963 RepID=UPI003BAA98AE
MSDQEKKDKKFSMIMSVIVHGTILTFLLFLVAWRQPDPPIPEYGIELNFGFEEAGSGDIERENEAEIEETENDTPPESEQESEEDPVEETPVEQKVQEVVPPKQEVVKEVAKETPKEEVKAEVVQQKENVVKAEEKKVEEVVEKKEEEKPPVEVKKEVTKPVEEKKEEVKPKPVPVVDQRAIMGGGKKAESDSKEAASNNQGKEVDKRGNMGDPKGKTTTNGTKPGGADLGGVSLSLEGWKWDSPPTEKDDSQVDGMITFNIEVDDRGTVTTVTNIPITTIKENDIIEFYKKQVEKLTFTRTDLSKSTFGKSVGKITFVIKTS